MKTKKQQLREDLREDLLDELAPARHNRGKARYVGRIRKIKGDVEPGIEWDDEGGPLIEGDIAHLIEHQDERKSRAKRDITLAAEVGADVREHMAEHFPGIEPDEELLGQTLLALTPSTRHSVSALVRVALRRYTFALRDVLRALQQKGVVIKTREKVRLVEVYAATYALDSDDDFVTADWLAQQLRDFGITPMFAQAVLDGRICEHDSCSLPIVGRKKGAKHCSDVCRKAAARERRREYLKQAA